MPGPGSAAEPPPARAPHGAAGAGSTSPPPAAPGRPLRLRPRAPPPGGAAGREQGQRPRRAPVGWARVRGGPAGARSGPSILARRRTRKPRLLHQPGGASPARRGAGIDAARSLPTAEPNFPPVLIFALRQAPPGPFCKGNLRVVGPGRAASRVLAPRPLDETRALLLLCFAARIKPPTLPTDVALRRFGSLRRSKRSFRCRFPNLRAGSGASA